MKGATVGELLPTALRATCPPVTCNFVIDITERETRWPRGRAMDNETRNYKVDSIFRLVILAF